VSAVETACVSFLRLAHRADDGLFAYSTRVVGGEVVNDFEHPGAIRYTINTYLGLGAAARVDGDPWGAGIDVSLERFLRQHAGSITSPADLGLLTLLLAERRVPERRLAAAVDAVRLSASTGGGKLNMQDLAWMLWGASVAAGVGDAAAASVADSLYGLVRARFVHPRSRLPRHDLSLHRRHVVSFGSLVYFLRAMFEYARARECAEALDLFHHGVEHAIAIQGPAGEWPWMIDVTTGRPFDVYPIFSVHQDSMAMLFLFPAHDLGIADAEGSIERSVSWIFGRNELGVSMVEHDPFLIYRAIERAERASRIRRYLRSLALSSASAATGGERRINRECRSYHIGWILYAWSGRPDDIWGPLSQSAAAPDVGTHEPRR
jgi:hypothetical protein